MIEVSFDKKAMADIARDLEATPREIKRAMHLALNEVGRQMKSLAAKEVSKDTGVKRSALKPRILSFKRQVDGIDQVKLWTGVYRIPARKVGVKKSSVRGKVDISPYVLAVLSSDVIPLFESRFIPAFERKLRWLKSK